MTARTVRGKPTGQDYPSSIEDTAEEVTAEGGHGIALRCDHTDEAEVRDLSAVVQSQQEGLDVLVCNAWSGYMPYTEHNDWFKAPFWEQSMERWDGMFNGGLRAHLLTCSYGIPLMLPKRQGLVVLTTFTQGRRYLGNVFYDLAKNGACRAAEVLAEELEDFEIADVALSPGWMRVERMTGLTEDQLGQTESPEYIGRAVAALAGDPAVIRRAGQALAVDETCKGVRIQGCRRAPTDCLPNCALSSEG